jgi:hypothetical protein
MTCAYTGWEAFGRHRNTLATGPGGAVVPYDRGGEGWAGDGRFPKEMSSQGGAP